MTTSAVLAKTPDFIKRLAPVPGKSLPKSFKAAVSMLKRPYIPITAEALRAVEQVSGDSDVVLFDGKAMTFGTADGGYALMPLNTPLIPESVPLGTSEAALAHGSCNAPTYEELLAMLRETSQTFRFTPMGIAGIKRVAEIDGLLARAGSAA